MRIITGDDGGLLKSIDLEAQRIVVAGRQQRARAIRALCWARNGTIFAAARQDGVISLWEDGVQMPHLLKICKGIINADVVGMASTGGETIQSEAEELLVVAHEDGKVKLLAPFQSTADQEKDVLVAEWQLKAPLTCMALGSPSSGLVAVGGKERELGLYDLSTGEITWEARNVPHDKLSLRQPVWVTAAHFIDSDDEGKAGKIVAIGTGYKQVRIYDIRESNRRPVRMMDLPEGYRITTLCSGKSSSSRSNELVSGDAGGNVYRLDVGKMAVVGRMEGPAGSIRGLVRHSSPSLPFVALAGLDRMARVYDLRKPRKEAFRFYLKQRLTAVLFSRQGRRGKKGKAEEEEEEARAVLPAADDELDAMEDDVGSLDEEEGEEEEEEIGERGSDDEETEGGKKDRVRVQRIYENEEDDEKEEKDYEEEEEEDESDDEEKVTFGHRNDGMNVELNIVGELDEGDEEDSLGGVQETRKGGRKAPAKRPRR
ncbi:wd40 repeat-containing protein [Nannochloropsis oceanica]